MTSGDEEEIDFSTILAASVHDMKNSVGMLVASLAAAIEDQPPENAMQAQRLGTLHYEASRINNELVQLLTLYRMQNRHLAVRIDQHHVIDVLDESLARNHMLLDANGVDVEIQCDDELRWYFDSDLLSSLVQNILVNCARYTRSRILLAAETADETLVITIADDGPGYPARMRDAPTASVKSAATSSGETHLGLYFAQRIAAMHRQGERGGFIRLENGAPLGGGVFSVHLP